MSSLLKCAMPKVTPTSNTVWRRTFTSPCSSFKHSKKRLMFCFARVCTRTRLTTILFGNLGGKGKHRPCPRCSRGRDISRQQIESLGYRGGYWPAQGPSAAHREWGSRPVTTNKPPILQNLTTNGVKKNCSGLHHWSSSTDTQQ